MSIYRRLNFYGGSNYINCIAFEFIYFFFFSFYLNPMSISSPFIYAVSYLIGRSIHLVWCASNAMHGHLNKKKYYIFLSSSRFSCCLWKEKMFSWKIPLLCARFYSLHNIELIWKRLTKFDTVIVIIFGMRESNFTKWKWKKKNETQKLFFFSSSLFQFVSCHSIEFPV